ncbi:uncharacterized protein LOC130667497 [Microplitis mediator]|uniref:uncharacterized protein LOC130667497 n=1 Tax=Microplitis mediator TaxID=375433 RepID=UPI002552D418|nr:uncharacterized protein LOC130667497 [Microplitis mediator]
MQPEKVRLGVKNNNIKSFVESLRQAQQAGNLTSGVHNESKLSVEIEEFKAHVSKGEVIASNIYVYDENLIESMCKEPQHLYIDATFDACPQFEDTAIHQLLTIMVKVSNPSSKEEKPIPCITVLMTNKAEVCYVKIFEFIKNKFPTFDPSSYMSDYEIGLHNALKRVFPKIIARHCYFHYSQAIFRKAQQLKLINKSKNSQTDPDIFIVLHQINRLPLFPPNLIEQAYSVIKEEAINDFGDMFNTFFDYFESFWLRQITPAGFSVYGMRSDRTNNHLESYHSNLNGRLQKHPSPNAFITVLKEIFVEARSTRKSIINNNYRPLPPKKKTKINETEIQEFWDSVEEAEEENILDGEQIIEKINSFKKIQELIKAENKILKNQIENIDSTKTIEKDIEETELESFLIMGKLNSEENFKTLKKIKRKYLQNEKKIMIINIEEKKHPLII